MSKMIVRGLFVAIGVILQLGFELSLFFWFNSWFTGANVICYIAGVLIVLYMLKNSTRLNADMAWIITILLLPIFGTVLMITIKSNGYRNVLLNNIYRRESEYFARLKQDEEVTKEIEDKNLDQLRYISKHAGFPVSKNNHLTYYPSGEEFYPELLKELEKAEKFIFMEYFIIGKGVMWNGILDVLKRKAKEGVEIRLMYDDAGSMALLPVDYSKELEEYGIKCVPFNKLSPFRGVFMNNRDHRKITVIDGKVGFTGGVNISDEYINVNSKLGYWKDNGIRIEGDAVFNLTVLFLSIFNANNQTYEDIMQYKADHPNSKKDQDGYVVTYGSAPLHKDILAEDIYLNMINAARDYIYIDTPYLIIDTDMINSLVRAAKRGVDVRIVVPGIPDKKIVYTVTSSYFEVLMNAGVKIYKFTPGFVHAKVFVVDDVRATVGTVNMDYRSLYLHFENGIYMENNSEIPVIKKDLLETMDKCKLVTMDEATPSYLKGVWEAVLRLFAPMF